MPSASRMRAAFVFMRAHARASHLEREALRAHLVATGLFGAVKTPIGDPHQLAGVAARRALADGRDADAHRDLRAGAPRRDARALHGAPHAIGQRERLTMIARPREDRELLAAIAREDVRRAQHAAHRLGDLAERAISFGVPIVV